MTGARPASPNSPTRREAAPAAERPATHPIRTLIDHTDALRRVASRMAGILHGCLKTGTGYDEDTARQQAATDRNLAAAVTRARQAGHPWSAIGARPGITRQAAQQRFGAPSHASIRR